MRSIVLAIAAAGLFTLGATSSTDCVSSLVSLLSKGITIPTTVSVHVINDAYEPVSVSLGSGTSGSGSTTQPALQAALAEAAASQPSASGAAEPGQDVKIASIPCASIVSPIWAEAKFSGSDSSATSASSPQLYYGDDFACGDRVNFIIRPAAMVGFVVGYKVEQGAAD